MYPHRFDYVRADSLDHAVALLGEHAGSKVIAGGHSLLPMMKLRLAHADTVIDIGRLAELRGVERAGDRITLGALTTHHELATSDVLRRHCPLVSTAAAKIGDPAVRNKGTIGGNIAHADPASDLPAVLVALDAAVHVKSADAERRVPARELFVGLLHTDLHEGEILTAVEVPVLGDGDGSAYLKVEHPASGYAVCGAAAVVQGDKATLAFNGIADTPVLASAVTDALEELSDAAIDAAVDAHLAVEHPLSDVQASGEYRVQLAKVYGKRALEAARDARG